MEWLRHLTAEGWTAVIALIALVLSVGQLVVGLLSRLAAKVVVDLQQGESAGAYTFVLENVGAATAREVDLDFGSISDDDSRPIFRAVGRLPLPVQKLAPDHIVNVRSTFTVAVPSTFEVEVSWRDRRPWRHRATTTLGR